MHMTHVNWHRTHSYRSHASHYDHSVGSADFPDIFRFVADKNIFTSFMVDDFDLIKIYISSEELFFLNNCGN